MGVGKLRTVVDLPAFTRGVSGGVRGPYDTDGALLLEGDRVKGTSGGFPGESAIVMRATWGTLICVRLDSSGQICSSAAHLWKKDPTQ